MTLQISETFEKPHGLTVKVPEITRNYRCLKSLEASGLENKSVQILWKFLGLTLKMSEIYVKPLCLIVQVSKITENLLVRP